jgi:hypothetical protein
MKYTVYHGTEHKFKTFNFNHCGRASGVRSNYVYFTSKRSNALYYGHLVLTVQLTLSNPRIIDNPEWPKSVREYCDETVLSNFQNDTEYDGVIIRDTVDGCEYSDVYAIFEPEQAVILETEDTSID